MGAFEGTGRFDALDAEETFPGVRRQMFSTARATVSRYTFSPGASFPLHRHPQEQVTVIEEGAVEVTIAGERSTLGAGGFCVVGPDVEHGITAGGSGAKLIAVVVPPRGRPDEYTIAGEGR
jgi:quercetin dioxygenase-like cupin family protein